MENEGALTADMVASATATVNGETVYPMRLASWRTTAPATWFPRWMAR
ncbi:MAG: hypothetical protein ACLTYN_12165 [Dysosmobacter welbionis]